LRLISPISRINLALHPLINFAFYERDAIFAKLDWPWKLSGVNQAV
jgi:hypothetical protein